MLGNECCIGKRSNRDRMERKANDVQTLGREFGNGSGGRKTAHGQASCNNSMGKTRSRESCSHGPALVGKRIKRSEESDGAVGGPFARQEQEQKCLAAAHSNRRAAIDAMMHTEKTSTQLSRLPDTLGCKHPLLQESRHEEYDKTAGSSSMMDAPSAV